MRTIGHIYFPRWPTTLMNGVKYEPAELLAHLDRLGVRLEADGDRLRYYPRSTLTPELIARLKAHKGDVLAMLTATPDREFFPWSNWRGDLSGNYPLKTTTICRCGSITWQRRSDP